MKMAISKLEVGRETLNLGGVMLFSDGNEYNGAVTGGIILRRETVTGKCDISCIVLLECFVYFKDVQSLFLPFYMNYKTGVFLCMFLSV